MPKSGKNKPKYEQLSGNCEHMWARLQVGITCEPPDSLVPLKTTLHNIPLCILDLGSLHLNTRKRGSVLTQGLNSCRMRGVWIEVGKEGLPWTLPSIARECEFDPRSQGPHAPCGQKSNTQNSSIIVANSIRTLEMSHIKNLKKKRSGERWLHSRFCVLMTLEISDCLSPWYKWENWE